ncbi:MAG: hypothetical protein CMJ46_13280 [Planctomyces sp.]|nr:hypothetical protein [Planctomyces sp.]
MHRQFLITIMATTLLICGGWVYHQFVNPMLIPPTMALPNEIPPTIPEHQLGPVENRELANQHLGHVPWVQQNPGYQVKFSENAYVFAQTLETNGQSIKLEPFAMIWVFKPKPGETEVQQPLTVVCDSASVEFNDEYKISDMGQNIRAIKGQLRGNVEIRGDNGLALSGSNFVYSEEAMSVVCDDKQIQFRYNGNNGVTEGVADGLVVNLEEDPVLKRDGQIPFKNVRSVRLREHVLIHYQEMFDPDDPAGEVEGPVAISSDGSLIYDIATNTAQFLDNVQIHQQEKPGESVHLYAPEILTIELAGSEEEQTAASPMPVKLVPPEGVQVRAEVPEDEEEDEFEFRRVKATGDPVRLIVEEQELVVETKHLVYDSETRTAILSGPWGVSAQMGENHLQCPELQLIHNEDDDIESVIGRGRGKLVQLDEGSGDIKFEASWMNQMHFLHDFEKDHDIIQLDEQAFCRSPEQEFAASAGRILVRIEEWFPPVLEGSGEEPDGERQPVYVRAERNVRLQMQQMEARNDLTQVWIRDFTAAQAEEMRQAATTPETDEQGGVIKLESDPAEKKKREFDDPTTVTSERIIVVVHRVHEEEEVLTTVETASLEELAEEDEEKVDMQVHEAQIVGKVMMKRTSQKPNGNLAIAGDEIRYGNDAAGKEVVNVFGSPAEVQGDQAFLQGNQLQIYLDSDEAKVIGPGLLRLDISTDLEGNTRETPDKLTINWQEKMEFGGKTASFFGNVDTFSEANQSRINCQIMNVHFAESIAFSENTESSNDPEIDLVECLEHVHLQSKQYREDQLTEIHKGEVWQMRIRPETGAVETAGPGYFEIWSQEQEKKNLASLNTKSAVIANQSVSVSDSKWNYIRVDFAQRSHGNIQERNNTFEGDVNMIYGPVEQPHEKIRLHEVSETSGTMQAHSLNIKQIKRPTSDPNKEFDTFVQLLASGNVRLESEKFHARADQVSYDESKQCYKLKSNGKETVDLWKQDQVGGEWQQSKAKGITFFPEPKPGRVILEDVNTLQGVQSPKLDLGD